MIEDKEIGLKIADKEEAYWLQIVEQVSKHIENLEKELKFNTAVKEMAQYHAKRHSNAPET